MREAFGSWLKAWRLARGLSLREVARRAGVSQPYLWRVEGGGVPPSERLLRLLVERAGAPAEEAFRAAGRLPPADLLDGEGTLYRMLAQIEALFAGEGKSGGDAFDGFPEKLAESPDDAEDMLLLLAKKAESLRIRLAAAWTALPEGLEARLEALLQERNLPPRFARLEYLRAACEALAAAARAAADPAAAEATAAAVARARAVWRAARVAKRLAETPEGMRELLLDVLPGADPAWRRRCADALAAVYRAITDAAPTGPGGGAAEEPTRAAESPCPGP